MSRPKPSVGKPSLFTDSPSGVRSFVESCNERACPLQARVEIIDAEEEEQSVARGPIVGAHQGRMVFGAPLVKAEEHGPVRVDELAKVGMLRGGARLTEQRLVPPEASPYVVHADDRPDAFQWVPPATQRIAARLRPPAHTLAATGAGGGVDAPPFRRRAARR